MKIYIIPHPPAPHYNFLYTCPRGEKLVLEGLRQIPEVELVNTPEEADYYLLDYVPHANGEKWNRANTEKFEGNKLIVVDWTDEWNRSLAYDWFHYFKRSFCTPLNKENTPGICPSKSLPKLDFPDWHDISYGILDDFPRGAKPFDSREINIGCYLRTECPNRAAIYNFIRGLSHKLLCRVEVGPISYGGRSHTDKVYIDHTYFDTLENTQCLITVNPSWWEGDSRLWEGLAAGCLVFIDRMHTPTHFPLRDGIHLIYYDMTNLVDLRRSIEYYLNRSEEAKQIAQEGQKYALQHHTSKARIQYVIDTVKGQKSADLF